MKVLDVAMGVTGLGCEEGAERGVGGEGAVIAVAVSARWRDERGEPVEELRRGKGEHGLPVGPGPRQGVADALVFLVPDQPLAGKYGTGAIAQ